MTRSFRLLVDPPYPGESTSSFLGRTAQTYLQPVRTLIGQLMPNANWRGGRLDLDLWPPDDLLAALAVSVPNWQAQQVEPIGFHRWVLTSAARYAYCPTCFVEDLNDGRVPYFREDWMAVLTTACWKHRTPLCQWPRAAGTDQRRLPLDWVFQRASGIESYPDFFQADLDRLRALQTSPETDTDNPGLRQALQLLMHLQTLFEKQATSPMVLERTDLGRYSTMGVYLHRLCLLAVTYWRPETQPPAAYLRPSEFGDWFGPHPLGLGPREYEYRENSLRIGGDVSWRRTYLWFVARTLAGWEPFASQHGQAFQPWEPWKAWWERDVRRLCPAAFKSSFDAEAKLLLERSH